MTNPALPGEHPVPAVATGAGTPPPMPSIAASALLESRLLVAQARRAILALLMRG